MLDFIYFKALNLKSPGYQKFPVVVYNEKEHNPHDIGVFDQSLPITFPAYKWYN